MASSSVPSAKYLKIILPLGWYLLTHQLTPKKLFSAQVGLFLFLNTFNDIIDT